MNGEAPASATAERSSRSRSDGGALERRVPPFVVVARVLLLLVPAVALALALALPILRPGARDGAVAATVGRYVCPMHPEIVRAAPGDCPICNMALVPELLTPGKASADQGRKQGEVIARAERRFVASQVRAAASVAADGEGTAVLYEDDLTGLGPQEPAVFFGGVSPNMGIKAHLLLDSRSPIDPSTVTVHFRLDEAHEPPAGADHGVDVGSLQIAARARELLVVPLSAVLYSAAGPYVLASSRQGEPFAKRAIHVGRILDSGYVGEHTGSDTGAVVVLSGLNEGDSVVAGYTFFVDTERRLQAARVAREEAAR
jgi:hypothetical protein